LRQLSVGEIERRGELRGGNSNDPGFEPLGELACHIKPSLVRLIKGQTDHDGRICHQSSPRHFLAS
jgi:hypothetical protein